jgi:predicted DCC family thiol-disulfide oxidoreductase YuxK
VVDPVAQAPSGAEGRHLLLFDGVCGLCQQVVQFVLAHDRRRVFDFASLQSPFGAAVIERFGGNPAELSAFCAFADYRAPEARLLTGARATLFVLSTLGWPWRAAGVLGLLPTALLDRLYRLVARNRYRVFGRHEQCLVPRPEYRRRFIDS